MDLKPLGPPNCWWIEFPLSAKPPPAAELGYDLTNFFDKLMYAQYLRLWIHALATLLRCVERDENGLVDTWTVKAEDVQHRMMESDIEVLGRTTDCRSLQDVVRELGRGLEKEVNEDFTEGLENDSTDGSGETLLGN
ncbi:MAG: hypothetical protein M1812_005852 [Candelaria pacifica]|nr:MAG: hypothetical protein M1812_005852 [Candelaria pacifica]